MYRYQAARRAGSSARYGVCTLVGASPAIRSSTAMQCGARAAHPGQSVALPGSRSSVAATSRSVTSLAWVAGSSESRMFARVAARTSGCIVSRLDHATCPVGVSCRPSWAVVVATTTKPRPASALRQLLRRAGVASGNSGLC